MKVFYSLFLVTVIAKLTLESRHRHHKSGHGRRLSKMQKHQIYDYFMENKLRSLNLNQTSTPRSVLRDSLKLAPIVTEDYKKLSFRYKLSDFVETTTARRHPKPSTTAGGFTRINEYRRYNVYNAELKDQSLEPNAHCRYIITPLLSDQKNQTTELYDIHSYVVTRLVELIKQNLTEYDTQAVLAVLMEISDIPVRLFQWKMASITLLLNVIIQDKMHNFLSLRAGLLKLFNYWDLRIEDYDILAKQTKIIRPPCYQETIGGYTAQTQGTTYQRPNYTDKGKDDCI